MGKTKKSYKEYNVALTNRDLLVLAALYRHRLLTNQLIYRLIFEEKDDFTYRSMCVRLNKLQAHGYLNGVSFGARALSKDNSSFVAAKGYELTEIGLQHAIDELELDYNVYGPQGIILEKNSREVEDIKVNRQYPHHFAIQNVVINSLVKLMQREADTVFTDYEYSWGSEVALQWYDNENNRTESYLYPDWLFNGLYKGDKQYNQRYKIALEVDRTTMKSKQMEKKFTEYASHISNTDMYRACPLTLVIAVERDAKSKKRRIRSLKKNAFASLSESLYTGRLNVFIVDSQAAPEVIADSYLRQEPDYQEEVIYGSLHSIIAENSAYHLSASLEDYDSLNEHVTLKLLPDRELIYRKSEKIIRIFVVKMRRGDILGELKLLELESLIHKEKIDGFVLGVYPNDADIEADVFVDTKSESVNSSSFGEHIFVGSPSSLAAGQMYKVSLPDDRTPQRIRKVEIKDVLF
jgi:hypothetical protein